MEGLWRCPKLDVVCRGSCPSIITTTNQKIKIMIIKKVTSIFPSLLFSSSSLPLFSFLSDTLWVYESESINDDLSFHTLNGIHHNGHSARVQCFKTLYESNKLLIHILPLLLLTLLSTYHTSRNISHFSQHITLPSNSI